MALSDQIKKRRLEKKLSLSELARLARVSKTYIFELETPDGPRPSAEVLYRMAFALGTSAAELLEKDIPSPALELTDLPDGLRNFALSQDLEDDDIKMLASIHYRGQEPRSENDWRFIYESIKRSTTPEA